MYHCQTKVVPCLMAGLYIRNVLDAIVESSRSGVWVKVEVRCLNKAGRVSISFEDNDLQTIKEQKKEQNEVKKILLPIMHRVHTL